MMFNEDTNSDSAADQREYDRSSFNIQDLLKKVV